MIVDCTGIIRSALQEYLRRLHDLQLEEQNRRGYAAQRERADEYQAWENVATLPES